MKTYNLSSKELVDIVEHFVGKVSNGIVGRSNLPIELERYLMHVDPCLPADPSVIEFIHRPCKGPDAPNVQDVINAFQQVKNKALPVFGYISDFNGISIDIINLNSIDCSIEDRVDINLELSE